MHIYRRVSEPSIVPGHVLEMLIQPASMLGHDQLFLFGVVASSSQPKKPSRDGSVFHRRKCRCWPVSLKMVVLDLDSYRHDLVSSKMAVTVITEN